MGKAHPTGILLKPTEFNPSAGQPPSSLPRRPHAADRETSPRAALGRCRRRRGRRRGGRHRRGAAAPRGRAVGRGPRSARPGRRARRDGGPQGHPVDLGAHWLHAGPINPLVAPRPPRGEPLRRAPQDSHLFVGRPHGRPGGARRVQRAPSTAPTGRSRRRRARRTDRPAAGALPAASGRGASASRRCTGSSPGGPLARGQPARRPEHGIRRQPLHRRRPRRLSGAPRATACRSASAPPCDGDRLVRARRRGRDDAGTRQRPRRRHHRAGGRAGERRGPLLAGPAARRSPRRCTASSRASTSTSCCTGRGRPFRGADRLASLVGGRFKPPGLLTCIDGTPFHYFELDHPTADRPRRPRRRTRRRRFARAVLTEHFGRRALAGLTVPAVTDWRHDPLSRAAWAAVPPGRCAIRDGLKAPVGGRIWFAGEALSRAQSGTVGGAWEEGERAAEADREPRRCSAAAVTRCAPRSAACSAARGRAAGGRP